MTPGTFVPALKEWAIVCKALEEGRQLVLLRKGGILEYKEGFKLLNNKFLLFPTLEHQSTEAIQANYAHNLDILSQYNFNGKRDLSLYAEVSDIRHIDDEYTLSSLEKYHIWNKRYVEMRMKYNPKKPMSMVILRVYKMIHPISINVNPKWSGCRSWILIELTEENGEIFDRSLPVLDEDSFQTARSRILDTLI